MRSRIKFSLLKTARVAIGVIAVCLGMFASSFVLALDKPQRIVSLSLCTDELVIALAQKEHIAAVTYLAQDDKYSRYAKEAAALVTHHNQVEEIIGLHPDVIVGLDFEVGKTSALLQRLGYTIHQFPSPARVNEVASLVSSMGRLLGEERKADVLISQFNQQLNSAKLATPHVKHSPVLIYGPNGYSPGSQSIKSDLLRYLGWHPLADSMGQKYDGILPVALVLKFNPKWLIVEADDDSNSLAHRYLQHPALASWFTRAEKNNKQIAMPNKLWLCSGLGLGQAAEYLASAMQ